MRYICHVGCSLPIGDGMGDFVKIMTTMVQNIFCQSMCGVLFIIYDTLDIVYALADLVLQMSNKHGGVYGIF